MTDPCYDDSVSPEAVSFDSKYETEAWQEALEWPTWQDVKIAMLFCQLVKLMLWVQFGFWLVAVYVLVASQNKPLIAMLVYFFVASFTAYFPVGIWWDAKVPFLSQWVSWKLSVIHGKIDWGLVETIIKAERGVRIQAVVEYFTAALFASALSVFTILVWRVSDPILACVLASLFFWFRTRGAMGRIEGPFDIRYHTGMFTDALVPIVTVAAGRIWDMSIGSVIFLIFATYTTMLLFVLRCLLSANGVAVKVEMIRREIAADRQSLLSTQG